MLSDGWNPAVTRMSRSRRGHARCTRSNGPVRCRTRHSRADTRCETPAARIAFDAGRLTRRRRYIAATSVPAEPYSRYRIPQACTQRKETKKVGSSEYVHGAIQIWGSGISGMMRFDRRTSAPKADHIIMHARHRPVGPIPYKVRRCSQPIERGPARQAAFSPHATLATTPFFFNSAGSPWSRSAISSACPSSTARMVSSIRRVVGS